MGYEEDGSPLERARTCFDEGLLSLQVVHRRRLVENQDRGVLDQRSRKRNPLPLTPGQADAMIADFRLETLRQLRDELVGLRQAGGAFHLLIRRILQPISDVGADGAVE